MDRETLEACGQGDVFSARISRPASTCGEVIKLVGTPLHIIGEEESVESFLSKPCSCSLARYILHAYSSTPTTSTVLILLAARASIILFATERWTWCASDPMQNPSRCQVRGWACIWKGQPMAFQKYTLIRDKISRKMTGIPMPMKRLELYLCTWILSLNIYSVIRTSRSSAGKQAIGCN